MGDVSSATTCGPTTSLTKSKVSFNIYDTVRRPAFINVDLDAITNNVRLLRASGKNGKIGVIGLVKGDAYGHGAVPVARHLKTIGVERLAVAAVEEGIQLRAAGVSGPIHVFGSTRGWEVAACIRHSLIPTVCSADTVRSMAQVLSRPTQLPFSRDGTGFDTIPVGTVHIKVDSGMSRNGCQPEELPALVQLCDDLGVPLEGIFSHLADFEDKEFTDSQIKTYHTAIAPFRSRNLLFHLANSGGTLTGVGTELDFIRPGIALYGLPPGSDVQGFAARGFRPAASVHAQASLVKRLEAGRKVGYGCTYTCEEAEWVAIIPVGYADGYWRQLSSTGSVIRERTGEKCPVIGRVSMDAITVRVNSSPEPEPEETFTLISADFDPDLSATGIANKLGTITYEVGTRLHARMPRYYTSSIAPPEIQYLTTSHTT